jgi:hypothetical protein
MALPIPVFQAGLRTVAEHNLEFTWPSGENNASCIIAAGTFFPSTSHLLAEIWEQLEADDPDIADRISMYVTVDGKVTFAADRDTFDVVELTAATYGILDWLGLPSPINAATSVTGDYHARGFYPQEPLLEQPIFSRSLNQPRAVYRLRDGGLAHSSAMVAGQRGGFLSARFRLQYEDDPSADVDEQVTYRLISFLTGLRGHATDCDYGSITPGFFGAYDASMEAMTAVDDLPVGGVAENRIAYWQDWLDPDDYPSHGVYHGDVVALAEFWYLHPDLKEIVITPRYERQGDWWQCEFDAFGEGL